MFFGKPKKFYLDALERVIWTAVQAASATGIVAWANWDEKWIVPLATGIALLKTFLFAPMVGNPDTATTLPDGTAEGEEAYLEADEANNGTNGGMI